MLLGNSAQPQQWWKRENWKRGLMSKTKALNCPTNFVRFDWNGNEIITLISKIVVSLTVTAMTLISSEIPIQRLTLYKATFISCRWCSTCCCELSTIVGRVIACHRWQAIIRTLLTRFLRAILSFVGLPFYLQSSAPWYNIYFLASSLIMLGKNSFIFHLSAMKVKYNFWVFHHGTTSLLVVQIIDREWALRWSSF